MLFICRIASKTLCMIFLVSFLRCFNISKHEGMTAEYVPVPQKNNRAASHAFLKTVTTTFKGLIYSHNRRHLVSEAFWGYLSLHHPNCFFLLLVLVWLPVFNTIGLSKFNWHRTKNSCACNNLVFNKVPCVAKTSGNADSDIFLD